MVGLDGLEIERCYLLGDADKRKAATGVDVTRGNRVCPAGAGIEERVNVELLAHRAHMDRVDFHETAWFFGRWPQWVLVPFFPGRRVGEEMPLEGSLHRGERDDDAIFFQEMMYEKGITDIFLPVCNDGVNNLLAELLRMVVWL